MANVTTEQVLTRVIAEYQQAVDTRNERIRQLEARLAELEHDRGADPAPVDTGPAVST